MMQTYKTAILATGIVALAGCASWDKSPICTDKHGWLAWSDARCNADTASKATDDNAVPLAALEKERQRLADELAANGDGSADVKPIAHLYKTQVYTLARHLKLPDEICGAVPTTDTYSLAQGQDEFYFALPYQQMDMALYALNHGYGPEALAAAIGVTAAQAANVYRDIEAKRRATRYMHLRPVLVESVAELKL
jgi:hypothetical protein